MVDYIEYKRGGDKMLIALVVFDIIIIGLTILTTEMVEHKFRSIRNSLSVYCNRRAYKTKSNIDFIESAISEYKRLCSDTDEEPDLVNIINIKLHKECIGKFSYDTIKNMAIKTRHMMWGILGMEVIITWINEDFNGRYTLPTIFGSLLLTIIMCLYGIIKGVHEKQEILIDEVVHYIRNVYPSEVKKHEKVSGGADKNKTSVVQRMEDIKVQDEKKSNCKNDLKASSLRADDIAELLKSL